MTRWPKEAAEFAVRNRAFLASRPVWLFSSGPLGTETKHAEGPELWEATVPKEIAELREAIKPRDRRVFSVALGRKRLGFAHSVVRKMPAAHEALPEGDFCDWNEEARTSDIAQALENLSRPIQQ